MKVVFIGDSPNKAKLFGTLTNELREKRCASDRSGVWTPTAKAAKAAASWAEKQGLKYQLQKQDQQTSFTVQI